MTNTVRHIDQRSRYAALSGRLSVLTQMGETFLSAKHQNYLATVAEYFSEVRA